MAEFQRVPEGESGPFKVIHFTIDEEASRRTAIRSWRDEYVPPGDYTRLMRGGTVVMSDTPMELRTNRAIIDAARGRVLINGLGIGMVLRAILAKPDVERVTVIELAPEVIELVGPTYQADQRLAIIQGNALEYRPARGERFDAVWHDIWDDICADNLADMRLLHKRYGRRSAWQGSWGHADCLRQERRWNQQQAYWHV